MHTTKYKHFPCLFKPGTRVGGIIFSLLMIPFTLLSGALFAQDGNSTVFLVRHAEKTAEENDPHLSHAGKQRAEDLAALLANAEITGIFSTDYARTRDTAAPLADAQGLETRLYDPAQPGQLVESLKTNPGRYLVVGHSNTVPELVELLGGTPGADIDEKSEYDRLYVLTRLKGGTVNTILLRY